MDDVADPFRVLVLAEGGSTLPGLGEQLEAGGLDVVCASSPPEALAKIDAYPLAAIVVAIAQADSEQLQVVRTVRAAPRSRTTPILILGPDHPEGGFLEAAYELGGVDYLGTTADRSTVIAKVRGAASLFRQAARSNRDAERAGQQRVDNARLFQNAQNAAERLNLALSAAELGDWSWDSATDEVNLSERAAAVFGIPPGPTITWTNLQALLHPDDRERARAEVVRVIAQHEPYNIEYRVMREGRPVWIAALGSAIYDAAGQAIGMFGVVQDISGRKRLERSLSDSEARFRSLMEQAPFSIQVIAPDGRTLRVNKSWELLWGATLEQLGDYNILEDPQLEQHGVLPLIRQAFEGTAAFIPAIRYDPTETMPELPQHGDPVRWVSAVAYPIKDDAGELQQVVLVHEDVTARVRAETALRGSEERLRLALEAGQMGVWDWDIHTGDLQWSDTLEPLHGLGPGEFGGTFEAFEKLIHPEDRPRVASAIANALEQRSSYYTEFRNIRRDGSAHWIAGSGKVFTDESGNAARMIGIGLDVTGRRRTEQSAQFLSSASAALAEIVDFDKTLQKVAVLAVPSFADWAAVDVLEVDGALRRVAAEGDAADAFQGAWNVLRTGKPELVRDVDQLPPGVRSRIRVPLMVRGTVRGILSFTMAESGRSHERPDLKLAQDLAQRTAVAIENAELYEELRQADQQKDEFLATLAHELRNPLAPIRSGLHVIRLSGPKKPGTDQALAMMERQVGQLVRLVDDLLDVSRITRNRLELRKEPVSLAEVVRSAAETSQPAIERSGNTLAIDLPPSPVILFADRVRLAQVFSNLLNNAAKYSPDGGRIVLAAEREGDEVVVSVRDTGLGIPEESLARIFEMFCQVHQDTQSAQPGLGIGLTLVKRLVELHDGSIEARSEGPGRGSEFIVRLPVQAEGAEGSSETATPNATEDAPRRILVVDDNVDAAQTQEMMLSLLGHELRVAFDGKQAIRIARDFRPDLVLLDIGLPDMSGYDVCRALRDEPAAEGAVIVALTGWGQEADRRRSKEAGFDEHLVKPVDLDQLLPVIGRARLLKP